MISEESYLSIALAMGDMFTDLQQNGKTYYKEVMDPVTGKTIKIPVKSVYLDAYHNVLDMIAKMQQNPDQRLIPYDGKWYTKEEIDKMFYRDII